MRHDLTEEYNNTRSADSADNLNVVDCHILSVGHMLRTHKLACFDMDSTLIEQEVIVELAKTAGIGEEVEASLKPQCAVKLILMNRLLSVWPC
ncbi:hypothetical protein [Psychrobacter sp. JCM 18901]|uniref:hypothetical protein n=1 Tax=Psychrobacter sp. JCM 18901 TaxID=1298609 RepID=UPI0004BA0BC7